VKSNANPRQTIKLVGGLESSKLALPERNVYDVVKEVDLTEVKSLRYQDIFVPGGFPRHTYNPLVVDDFHYIPRDMQGSIVRALKPLIFNGLPVVIIAIPHRRYNALKVEKEMTGRISPIEIPIWSDAELQFISDTGFGLR